jgi:hypothetical protein
MAQGHCSFHGSLLGEKKSGVNPLLWTQEKGNLTRIARGSNIPTSSASSWEMRGRTQFISFCRSELSRVGPPLKSFRRCGMPCQCRQLAHRMAGLAHDGRERTLGALLERFGRTGTSLGSPVALTAAESQTSCRRRLNFMHRGREIYTKKNRHGLFPSIRPCREN